MSGRRDLSNFSSNSHNSREVSHESQLHSHENNQNQSSVNLDDDKSASGGKAEVGFRMQSEEYQEERKKYLTAKYGSQQMKLIRKRLFVEFWIDEELKKLYDVQDDADETYDCELDLDEILDLPDDHQRQQFIWDRACGAPKSEEEIMAFVTQLMQKVSSL